MKSTTPSRLAFAMVAALQMVGCITPIDESEDVATADEAMTSSNGVFTNGVFTNGVFTNGVFTNGVFTNGVFTNGLYATAIIGSPLTAESLTANPLTAENLAEPTSERLLEYIVSCALPQGTSFDVEADGVTHHFAGEIGLAPEWGVPGGKCNALCRGWVSSCILARLNFLGEPTNISIRATGKVESTSEERWAFPVREATYYGNIFETPHKRYACLSPGQTAIPRVCGPSSADCPVTITGSCDSMCEAPRWDGSFPFCRNGPKGAAGTSLHIATLTVFLKQ